MNLEGWQRLFQQYVVFCMILVPVGAFVIWRARLYLLKGLEPVPRPAAQPFWLQFLIGGAIAACTLLLTILPGLIGGMFSTGGANWQPFGYSLDLNGWPGMSGIWKFFSIQALVEELFYRALALTLFAALLKWITGILVSMSANPPARPEMPQSGLIWFWCGLIANLVISGAFAYSHMSNPGITILSTVNIGLAGAVLGQLFWLQLNIWGAWCYHLVWNAGLASLGLPVSGFAITDSPLGVGFRGASPGLLSGGSFGPEGSLANTIVLLAALSVLLVWTWRSMPGSQTQHAGPTGETS